MSSVVLTVKACYVASTKYRGHHDTDTSPLVVWRIRTPEKKPLLKREISSNKIPAVRKSNNGDLWSDVSRGNYVYKDKPLFRAVF